MNEYPALSEMGVKGFNEIKDYTVIQDHKDRDILRVSYKRKKGSMLPKRKTFRFGRSLKMVNDSTAPGGLVNTFEISPFLQKVMLELDTIIGSSNSDKNKVEALMNQVQQLEREMLFITTEMKSLLKDMK